MATSLAATIESAFNIKATLIEGHNGIYEVSVNENTIYSNQSCCSGGFPSDGMIIDTIGKITLIKPIKNTTTTSQFDDIQAPSCELPAPSENEESKNHSNQNNPGCGCGCG